MKLYPLITATLLALASQTASAEEYFCYGEDGSDLSITVNLSKKWASLNGEDLNKKFKLSGILESMPPQYVFGSLQECRIIFKPSYDEQSGNASYRCNSEKYPNALKLDLPCSLQ